MNRILYVFVLALLIATALFVAFDSMNRVPEPEMPWPTYVSETDRPKRSRPDTTTTQPDLPAIDHPVFVASPPPEDGLPAGYQEIMGRMNSHHSAVYAKKRELIAQRLARDVAKQRYKAGSSWSDPEPPLKVVSVVSVEKGYHKESSYKELRETILQDEDLAFIVDSLHIVHRNDRAHPLESYNLAELGLDASEELIRPVWRLAGHTIAMVRYGDGSAGCRIDGTLMPVRWREILEMGYKTSHGVARVVHVPCTGGITFMGKRDGFWESVFVLVDRPFGVEPTNTMDAGQYLIDEYLIEPASSALLKNYLDEETLGKTHLALFDSLDRTDPPIQLQFKQGRLHFADRETRMKHSDVPVDTVYEVVYQESGIDGAGIEGAYHVVQHLGREISRFFVPRVQSPSCFSSTFIRDGKEWMVGFETDMKSFIDPDGVRVNYHDYELLLNGQSVPDRYHLDWAHTPMFIDGQPAWFGGRDNKVRWYAGKDSSAGYWDFAYTMKFISDRFIFTELHPLQSGFAFQAIRDGELYFCRLRKKN